MTATIKLAVFDCDGTLVDSQHSINACMREAFSAVGREAPPLEQVRRVVGLTLAQAITVLVDDEDAPVAEIAAAYSDAWTGMRVDSSLEEPLFEGMIDVLEKLQAAGWLLGVATGKSMRGLRSTLERHALDEFFHTLQTADRARGKPDPEMLHFAMQETGADAVDTVMIGDTTFDMEMARAAGVRAIGVSWGYHQPDDLRHAGASVVVDTMADLGRALHFAEETA